MMPHSLQSLGHRIVSSVRAVMGARDRDGAAAIAFWAFFSIFPLLLLAVGATGFFFDSAAAQNRLREALDLSIPGSADFVERHVRSAVSLRGTLGLLGAAGLLWSASASIGAVSRSLDRVYGIEERSALVVVKLRQVGLAGAIVVIMVSSVALTGLIELLSASDFTLFQRIGFETRLTERVTGGAGAVFLTLVMFLLLYRLAPSSTIDWNDAIPGAILATFLFELAKRGFLLYLSVAANYDLVYGSLSAVIVMLLWLYISALLLLLGAEFNVRREPQRLPPSKG
jgi:membrane protein